MFDAGSTGTRVHVYQYAPRVEQASTIMQTPLSSPNTLAKFSIKPGISSYSENVEGIGASLKTLCEAAAAALKLHDASLDLSHVPLYLGATAGVRNLTAEAQRVVMRGVRAFFRSKDNPFAFRHDAQARILSGEEEGTFAWLGLNYFMDSISASGQTTHGSLDFGGDSMQIAFVPQDNSILAGFFPLHFSTSQGLPIHLYTHSFLQFGKTASFERATTELMRELNITQGSKHTLFHPCMPNNLTWHVNAGEFGVSTRSESPEREDGKIVMKGTGDFAGCEKLASRLVVNGPCFQPPCSAAGVYQPPLRESRFVLLSSYDILSEWQVVPLVDGGMPLLQALRKQIGRICAMPMGVQREIFTKLGLTKDARGVPPCWIGTWMLTFLSKGLKFKEDTKNLIVRKDCCDSAAGRAIYEVNFFPYQMSTDTNKDKTNEIATPGLLGLRDVQSGSPTVLLSVLLGALLGVLGMLPLVVKFDRHLLQSRRGTHSHSRSEPLLLDGHEC